MKSPPEPEAMVVRDRSAVVIASLVADVVFGALAVLMAVQGVWYTLVLLPVLAAGAVWAVVHLRRPRLEVGTGGVRVPHHGAVAWEELARVETLAPRTLRLTLRDGRAALIPNVTGARRGQEKVGFDALVEAIQERLARQEPVPPKDVPSTITFELRHDAFRSWYAFLGIGGVLLAVGAVLSAWVADTPAAGTAGMAVGAAAAAVSVALSAMTVRRARTEIGPDGIRSRALRKEWFVPWDDIEDVTGASTPPRVIQLVRRGGGTVTVAAVRDDGAAREGLGFDDVLALVRERAGVTEDAEDAEARVPARPLSLRPSRRPLLWMVPLLLLLGFVLTRTSDHAELLFMNGLAAGTAVFVASMVLRLLLGRTDADADGIRNHPFLRTRVIPWEQVATLSVVPTLFGRTVNVQGQAQGMIRLAAPRSGLLDRGRDFDATLDTMQALAAPRKVVVDRTGIRTVRTVWWIAVACLLGLAVWMWAPWKDPWSPWRDEATALPHACDVADPATARRMVPDAEKDNGRHHDYTYFLVTECDYSNRSGDALHIDMELKRRSSSSGGTEEARESLASQKAGGFADGDVATRAVPGLGDQSWRTVESDKEDGDTRVRLLVRHANVLIDISYRAERPASQVAAAAEALARRTIDRVDLE